MANAESVLQAASLLAASKLPGVRLLRNHVGAGHTGPVVHRDGPTVTISPARACTFGLAPGSADLIGWASVEITPDMIGKRVAVLCSVELKAPGGAVRPEQRQWMEVLRAAGARAGIARSVEEVQKIVLGQ